MKSILILTSDQENLALMQKNKVANKNIPFGSSIGSFDSFAPFESEEKNHSERKTYFFEFFQKNYSCQTINFAYWQNFNMKSVDSIIIMTDDISYSKDVMLINKVVASNINMPILFLLELKTFTHTYDKIVADLKKISNNHRKCFIVNYDGNANYQNILDWLANAINRKNLLETSESISTSDLIGCFLASKLTPDLINHYGKLRILFYALTTYGYTNTANPDGWFCANWKKFKKQIGQEDTYNYTLTKFWIDILCDLQLRGNYQSFHDLYTNNPFIHNSELHKNIQFKNNNRVLTKN